MCSYEIFSASYIRYHNHNVTASIFARVGTETGLLHWFFTSFEPCNPIFQGHMRRKLLVKIMKHVFIKLFTSLVLKCRYSCKYKWWRRTLVWDFLTWNYTLKLLINHSFLLWKRNFFVIHRAGLGKLDNNTSWHCM